jgi:hypothetical protein
VQKGLICPRLQAFGLRNRDAGAPRYFWLDVGFRPRVTAGLGNGEDLAHSRRHDLMYRAVTSIVPFDAAISPVATVDQPRLPLAQATHEVFSDLLRPPVPVLK